MSMNSEFVRKFIILKSEFSNMKGMNPRGHGKLILRNNKLNISFNIENGEKNEYYNVILLTGKDVYDLGRIFTNEDYLGKSEFNLNYKELEKEGFAVGEINGILMVRGLKVLLGGYFNENDNTIENYMENLKIQKIEGKDFKEKAEEELEEKEKIGDKEKFTERNIGKDIEKDAKKTRKETKKIGKTGAEYLVKSNIIKEQSKKEDHNKQSIKKDPIRSEINTEKKYDEVMSNIFEENTNEVNSNENDILLKNKKNNQKNLTTEYVLNILSFFPYIEPFRIDLQGYNWWKIDIDNLEGEKSFLPYFSYIVGGNHKYPIIKDVITANDLINKYGHYIFGLYNINNEVKFYVYGVPGQFLKEEHPQKGNTGFNTWFEGKKDYGYWLLYIDPIGGRTIHPVNPIIPVK